MVLLYVAVLAVVWLGNRLGPERWWWSSLNLYLPQWGWALPGLLLLPLTLWRARPCAILVLLALLWVTGPLMGYHWRWTGVSRVAAQEPGIRVMTYNVSWLAQGPRGILAEVQAAKPDVLLIQDAAAGMRDALERHLPGFEVWQVGQYLIASKLPVTLVEERVHPVGDDLAESFTYMRCQVLLGDSTFTLYNVHLLTPRDGLAAVKTGAHRGIPTLMRNVAARAQQGARLVAEAAQEYGPFLLTGDLNAPAASSAYHALLGIDLVDAFAAAGRGYGYTYGHTLGLRHSYLRLDYILVSPHWRVRGCEVGGAGGSDHRPVIADLTLATARSRPR